MALCAVELDERATSLEEKEQGLLFLEAQLEETSAELERRGEHDRLQASFFSLSCAMSFCRDGSVDDGERGGRQDFAAEPA